MLIKMKKILSIAFLSILIMVPLSLSAQKTFSKKNVSGSWLGNLSAGGTELRVVFNVILIEKDSLKATLDSPDQGAKDIPCGQVTFDKQKLVILAPVINGEFSGALKNDSTLEGTWTQNGGTFPLNLKKQGKQK